MESFHDVGERRENMVTWCHQVILYDFLGLLILTRTQSVKLVSSQRKDKQLMVRWSSNPPTPNHHFTTNWISVNDRTHHLNHKMWHLSCRQLFGANNSRPSSWAIRALSPCHLSGGPNLQLSDMDVSKNRGGPPRWMVKIMENPIKMDDLGNLGVYTHYFRKHPYGFAGVFQWDPNFGEVKDQFANVAGWGPWTSWPTGFGLSYTYRSSRIPYCWWKQILLQLIFMVNTLLCIYRVS